MRPLKPNEPYEHASHPLASLHQIPAQGDIYPRCAREPLVQVASPASEISGGRYLDSEIFNPNEFRNPQRLRRPFSITFEGRSSGLATWRPSAALPVRRFQGHSELTRRRKALETKTQRKRCFRSKDVPN